MWYSIKAVSESDASESERGFAEGDRTLKIEQRIDEKEKTCQFLKSSRNTTQGKVREQKAQTSKNVRCLWTLRYFLESLILAQDKRWRRA